MLGVSQSVAHTVRDSTGDIKKMASYGVKVLPRTNQLNSNSLFLSRIPALLECTKCHLESLIHTCKERLK